MASPLKLLFCSAFLVLSFSLAIGQSWLWGKAGYGSMKSNVLGSHVAVDKNGYAYSSGMFDAYILFSPDTLKSGSDAGYVVKYDSLGNVKWAIMPGNSYSPAIALDTAGYPYITGENTSANFYIMKMDTGGHTIWNVSGNGGAGYCITSDKRGYEYVAGTFTGSFTLGSYNLTTVAASQLFIAKFDGGGNVIWVVQPSGDSNTDIYNMAAICTDNNSDVYVTLTFNNTITFGANIFTDAFARNGVILVRYDSAGNLKWAVNPYVPSYQYSASSLGVTADNANNCYLTGYFSDSITFGTHALGNTRSQWTMFLAKYDTNGKALWAEQPDNNSLGFSLTSDPSNHVYLSFFTYDSISFGLKTYVSHNLATGIIKLDTSGKAICGTLLNDVGGFNTAVGCDVNGNYFYMAGISYDSVFATSDTMVPTHGGSMPYVVRWMPCFENRDAINELKSPTSDLSVFPNPFTNATTIVVNTDGKHYLELDDLTGRKLRYIEFTGNEYILNAQDLAKGLYFVRVFNNENNAIGTMKIVVQ